MGYLFKEFVNAVVSGHDLKKHKIRFDNLIKMMDEYPNLFSYKLKLTNNENCFMMNWDGSKEGWGESEEADELRKKFIAFLKGFDYADIYHIQHGECEEPILINENPKKDEE
ncbi:hypothetical protein LCGC14_1081620 [marine sediment metagenome]|uniref:Uncharacterized protein n=1 Tax=marine sediment metagenome TaxID=412755 RepID=A0A0F9PYA0_9ZZZZ